MSISPHDVPLNPAWIASSRGFLVVAMLLCCSCASPLAAQNRSDAVQLFMKAADLTDLQSANGKPFELNASIEVFGNNGQSFHGTYRLQWNSKDQWREAILIPGYQRLRVGGERREWRQRSTNFELLPIWQLDNALEFPWRLRSSAPSAPPKSKREKSAQGSLECVRFKGGFNEEDFCFDSTKGVLAEERLPKGATGGEESVRARKYSDFAQFGDKVFPNSIQIVGEHDEPLLIFSDTRLTPLAQTSPADFAPPPGAEEWITCDQPEKPQMKRQVPPVYPTDARLNHKQGTVVLYALIGTDGLVHNLKVVGSASSSLDDAAIQAVSQWQYQPRKCNGVPAPVETFIDISFALN